MRKIPTLFQRDPGDRAHVTSEPNPAAMWVLAGEGVATRKFDGTCFAKIESLGWMARREVRPGKQPPANFVPVERDEVSGKTFGWEPAEQSSFVKAWREAVLGAHYLPHGTYELVGPRINGNPEHSDQHRLIQHGSWILDDVPRNFEGLRRWLLDHEEFEGIVWHHPDGRMAKLKRRDFA